jgi:hypothetical protein
MPASHQPYFAAVRTKWVPLTALFFALVAGVLAWQQRQGALDLTKQMASLAAEVADKNDALQKRAALIDRLREENEAYIRESALLWEKKSTRGSSAQDTETNRPPASSNKKRIELASKSFEDPRVKEMFRQKETAQLKQIYGDFVKESHLNAQQSEQLFGLFIEEEMREMEVDTKFFNGDEDDTDSSETEAKSSATRKAELDHQLQELLGDTGFAKYEAYEKTTRERQTLQYIREQLGLNSTPLRDDQAKTLLQILMEERARTPLTVFDPSGPQGPREKFRAVLEGDNAEQYYKAQIDFNQRILNRTGTLLSAGQYEALENFQNQYLEVSKVGIEMVREIMAPKQDSATTPAIMSSPTP